MSNELHVLYFSSDLFVDVAATSIVSLLESTYKKCLREE